MTNGTEGWRRRRAWLAAVLAVAPMSAFFIFLWAVDGIAIAMIAPAALVLLGVLGGFLAAPFAVQAVMGPSWVRRGPFDKIVLYLLAAIISGGVMGGVGCAAAYGAYRFIISHRSYC